MHALAKLLALLRGPPFTPLHHAATPVHVPPRVAPQSAKNDLAKNQNPKSLPEIDQVPAKKGGHQPIPKSHHHETKHGDEQRGKQHELQSPQTPMPFHVCCPHSFLKSS